MASDMFAITTARPTNVSMQYPFPPRHKVYTSSLSAQGGAWHASFDADYDGVSLICFSRQVVTAYHHRACSCTISSVAVGLCSPNLKGCLEHAFTAYVVLCLHETRGRRQSSMHTSRTDVVAQAQCIGDSEPRNAKQKQVQG
jgi:hypothetical protein